jgi:hypothetical protein
MPIFIMQYQHNTELPSLVQDDESRLNDESQGGNR